MIERLPNIRHLAALVATVEHGTVTEAARSVHLTQPALTQAIARLERTLECRLFQREPDGMKPTPPALLLDARARTLIPDVMFEYVGVRTKRGIVQDVSNV